MIAPVKFDTVSWRLYNPKESFESREQMTLDRSVYISTYGCQMNVNDTERMYSLLEMSNFRAVNSADQASVIIINACSIREKPVHKVYSEVGTYRKLKEKNPLLKIGVGGCVGQQEKDKLMKNHPLIDFVFGTDTIDQLPELVNQVFLKDEKLVRANFEHRSPYHVETLVRAPGVATFVNITKGCDNFCSFCVVPYTRGREKSRPLAHILTDIQTLTQRGVKEVTLLGQNVNSYESEDGSDFADLLNTLAEKTDLQRIRFVTSHPKDFDQKLVDVIHRNYPKVCEYIHLPFQSGNTEVLRRMNRGYSREEYLEKISMIKKAIPNVVLSTDIIVGFPGETEEQFADTMSLVQTVGFETIFAFKYSPRPFTKAAQFTDQVDESVKSERLQRLFDMHNKMAFDMVKTYEGQILDVLVEKNDHGKLVGRSSQNKLVYFIAADSATADQQVGKMLPVRILQAAPAVLRGEQVMLS
ncbi:MAG: tRNA (N6-isopentenyl adenosine(37)-C2)-methylthiotransferase MiaB [Pseudobdellovibrionaceae bacterium]